MDHYLAEYPSITSEPLAPTSLVDFGEAVDFPLIFGAMLAVFGAATLAHLLVVDVSRRRREVGLLKVLVLGFANRQVVSTDSWQATTLALVGVVIGVPLGLIVGRTVWNAFANNLGAVPGGRRAVPADRGGGGGHPRRCQRHRHRSGPRGDAIEAGRPAATSRLKAV